jgi:hypothetical protein
MDFYTFLKLGPNFPYGLTNPGMKPKSSNFIYVEAPSIYTTHSAKHPPIVMSDESTMQGQGEQDEQGGEEDAEEEKLQPKQEKELFDQIDNARQLAASKPLAVKSFAVTKPDPDFEAAMTAEGYGGGKKRPADDVKQPATTKRKRTVVHNFKFN